MTTLRVLASRHSAFYSPLLSTVAAGFLKEQGLDATYGVLSPGQTSQALIREGVADIIQSAVSSNWKPMERGESPLPVHFAQINRRDGFFLVSRTPDASFQWKDLEGRALLADHGGQPMAMLRYAAKHQAVDWSRIQAIDAGTPEQMIAAFLAGTGDYVHLQGPAAQQIELARTGPARPSERGGNSNVPAAPGSVVRASSKEDRAGHIVAAVGEAMPPVAFSSLCAAREFLKTTACQAFLRAFARAKEWVRTAPPAQVALKLAALFPGVTPAALAAAIGRYQTLGCWDGGVEIPRDLYEQSLNVFESAGAIARRHPYDEVCAAG